MADDGLGPTMEVVMVPQVQMGGDAISPAPAPNDGRFSGDWKNFDQDMANIKAEVGASQPKTQEQQAEGFPNPPAQEPVQPPEQTNGQPATAPATQEQPKPEVPDKFLKADGTVDQDRLLKSYQDAEKALKRAQQQARAGVPQQYPQQRDEQGRFIAQPQAAPDTFEALIEADLQKEGPGKTLAKLFNAAKQAAYNDARADIESFHERIEEQSRALELKAIGEKDPWVFTQQGFEALKSIRESNPWVNSAPEPWRAAYLLSKGQASLGGSKSPVTQVQTPTPKAPTAPTAPVGAVGRTQALRLDTPEQLQKYLKTLNPEQEKKFWGAYGLRF